MKKTLLLSVSLLFVIAASAQNFQGRAEYFTKRIMKDSDGEIKSEEGEPKLDPEMVKQIQDAIKKASEKKFILSFNKQESLYEQEEVLQQPKAANGGMVFDISFSGEGKKYTNLKDRNTISEDEIFGKDFLIVEKLQPLNWQLLEASKKIGDYTCYKAQVTIPVSEAAKKEYEDYLKKEKKSSLFLMSEPKDKIVTAWYTPEIPVGFGPDNYWGLPGLILEVNEEETIILCSKIVMTTKENAKIKVPNNGQKVSQKEFDEIQKKKTDSMKDEDGNIIFTTTR